MTAEPWRRVGDAVHVRVRLTPKGGRDAIDGLTDTPDGTALKARVRAVPENNAANDALLELIADWIGVPRRDVAMASGGKSRVKSIAIAGDPAILAARLTACIDALKPS